MQAMLLIMLVQALILVAVWWWDDHIRRRQRDRRHLEILQTRSDRGRHDGATPSAAAPPS